MKYLHIDAGILTEILPEFDESFPGVPIQERYEASFLSQCITRTDEQVQEQGIVVGMLYSVDTDTFTLPPTPEPVPGPEPEPEPEPEPAGYTITEEEVNTAYMEGVNNVE